MMLSAGEPFAGYTIVRPLGAGGMGEVYLAQHPRLPRREALKILRTDISADDSFRQRFIREADSVAALEHPNIVTVHDRGECDGRLWIATQFVEGSDAAQLVRDRYPAGMPVDEVAAITAAIADALDYAHGRGLLHRDVKPANILISDPDRDGNRRIYLADFGIARPLDDPAGLTATNFTFGTVAYSAPEQLMGKDIDGRADQYALAATAYHLLTGSPVYSDTNPVAVISRHLAEPPPEVSRLRPELASLNGVLAKALSKNSADRYPRCSDFARDLHARIADLTLASPSAPTAQAPTPPPPAAAPKPAPTAAPPSAKQRGGGSRAAVVISLITLGIAAAVGITVWRDHNRTTTVATATPTNGPSTTAASASPPPQSSTAATTPTSAAGRGCPSAAARPTSSRQRERRPAGSPDPGSTATSSSTPTLTKKSSTGSR
ncbi:MAG: serine/threonine-protein kinase [Mycobacteriaceae bacterium]